MGVVARLKSVDVGVEGDRGPVRTDPHGVAVRVQLVQEAGRRLFVLEEPSG